MYLFAPLSTFLSEKFGCRKVVILAGFVSGVSLACSSFAKGLLPLYFSYGVGWGVGTSFGLFPSLVMLTKYFRERLSLVNGIALSGAAVGSVVLAPLVQQLCSAFGTPNMFRFLGGLNVLMVFSGMLYRPVHDEEKFQKIKSKRKFIDKSLFQNKGFVIWMVALSTLMLVFLVPFVHLVSGFIFNEQVSPVLPRQAVYKTLIQMMSIFIVRGRGICRHYRISIAPPRGPRDE